MREAAVTEGNDLVQAVVQAEGPHVPESRRENSAEIHLDLPCAVKRAVIHADEGGLQAERRRGGQQAGQSRPAGKHAAEMSRMRCHTISAGTASSAG